MTTVAGRAGVADAGATDSDGGDTAGGDTAGRSAARRLAGGRRRHAGAGRSDGRTGVDPWLRWAPAVVAAIAYVPLLLTHIGKVGADTKQYLYLDPGRLLARAPSMWDPNVGMGTVTHENIGYLLPMGPWYWGLHALGVPTWVAQRLWTATLLFLAGLGVLYLLRSLGAGTADDGPGPEGPAVFTGRAGLVAALAYALTPYVLEYEARISAILMPWAALPWMLTLVVRGVRARGWRHPALFAIVVALCGGVNATSLIYAGIAPVLWILYAVFVLGEADLRRGLATALRVGVLTVLGSLWWISGLWTQAGYGLDVLRYTETVQVVAQTGSPIEVLRGLGNWYFYGRDTVAPWVQPAAQYTQQLWRLAVSYLVPIGALVGAVSVRWRHKLYFVGLIAVGLAIAVGVHPYDHPSPVGGVFKVIANSSSAGLALRSVGRAVPLVALGTAVLLGAGIDALLAWRPTVGAVAAGGVALLVLANMAPLFTGQFVDDSLQRPERLPAYWTQAISALDRGSHDTRVLELPGADFSHYRWGTTLDPITPGLMDRPFVGRELIPYGSPGSADLLRALDEPLQDGVFEPSSLAPIARLMNVGDVVLRSDLQYERFRTPRPRSTWEEFSSPVPAGLTTPVTYGPPVAERPVIPLTDEISLATPPGAPDPPAVAVFGVPGAAPIVHAETAAEPLLVAGDGQGLVDAGAAGVLDQRSGPVLYAADLARDPSVMSQALHAGADLLVTDTNRQRGQRWGTIRDNNGYTEQAGEEPLILDPTDARLPVFPGAGQDAYTVAEQRGVAAVRATSYGNPVSYDNAHRPDQALDGDPLTSWQEGAFSDVNGGTLRIDLAAPVTTDHITLVQPLVKPNERWITKVTVLFNGGPFPFDVALDDSSRTAAGQVVRFPMQTFRRLDIRVDASNFGRRADYRGGSGVGFSEVRVPGVHMTEFVRLPTDLLAAAGQSSVDHRLEVLLTRLRSQPLESFVTDEEVAMARTFDLPTTRTFALRGTARLSATATDAQLDVTEGRPGLAAGAPVATSGGHLPGDLLSRASAAIDAKTSTAWQTEFGDQEGNYLDIVSPRRFAADHLDLSVVADGRHSVPTRVRVQADGASPQDVDLPPIADRPTENATATVRVPLAPVAGSRVRVTVLAVRKVQTVNYFSQVKQPLPMGIAEVSVPGIPPAPPMPISLPSTCRSDLLTVDGRPVPLQVRGSVTDGARGAGFDIALCPGTPPLLLGAGHHDVRATPGRDSGIDIDRLLLASDRGGAALALGELASSMPAATPQGPASPVDGRGSPAAVVSGGGGSAAPRAALGTAGPSSSSPPSPSSSSPPPTAAPRVTVVHQGRTSLRLRVDGPAGSGGAGAAPGPGRASGAGAANAGAGGAPYWLVLGQSHNPGWRARMSGPGIKGSVSLGAPKLVDGYANGWLVPAGAAVGPLDVTLTWTPQRAVDIALVIAAVSLLACVVIGLWPRRRGAHAGASATARGARARAGRAGAASAGAGRAGAGRAGADRAGGDGGGVSGAHGPIPAAERAPRRPQLWAPWKPAGRPLGRRAAAIIVVASALGAAFVIGPLEAVAVASGVAVVLARPRWRALLSVGAIVLLVASTLYVLELQLRYHFPPKIEWPNHFDRIALVPWIAVAWVVADTVIEHISARWRPRHGPVPGLTEVAPWAEAGR